MLPFSLPIIFLLISSAATAIRVNLTHIDAAGEYAVEELIARGARRSMLRRKVFEAKAAAGAGGLNGQSAVHWGGGEYLMELAVGTPPVPLISVMDTGSNFIWTQCSPCVHCFQEPTPIFDPQKSSTFALASCTSEACATLAETTKAGCTKKNACEYVYSYADKSATSGLLASETYTFGSSSNPVSIPNMPFGCSIDSTAGFDNTSGLVGLGIGKLSLIASLDALKFAYCLAPYFDFRSTSTLLLGSSAQLSSTQSLQSTPILFNKIHPFFYYISLEGISIGTTLLQIPTNAFDIAPDGSGGTIIDSGTTFSNLIAPAYRTVRQHIVSIVNMPIVQQTAGSAIDLCFSLPSGPIPDMPDMIFHFDGGDMTLPKENYMMLVPGSGLLCLAMMEAPGISILGNFQQQNIQILYDLESAVLSFEPAQCSTL